MPVYELECVKCNNAWEEIFGPWEDLPPCPKCKSSEVKRLISLTAPGRVELTGHDLKTKVLADSKKDLARTRTDENFRANLVGEDKYQVNVSNLEKK